MTHTFSLRYFHKVSTIHFSGNSLWEDLVVLKRTVVVTLPLSLDLPSSIILDGSALRGIQGHCQMVRYRWMGALVRAQSSLIIIISVFGQFLLSLGHVHFQFNVTFSIHSLSSFHFFKFFTSTEACRAVYHHHCSHLLVSFLGLLSWWLSLIIFPFLYLIS